ncbi:MAG: hypothetical protein KA712_07345 [Myxococcales bacterium]|nr:hypothetical protein [Myxococcales bacterium]
MTNVPRLTRLARTGVAFLATARQGSALLVHVATGSLALLLVTAVLQWLDPRQLGGASVWLKPAKFAASVVVTAPLLAWALAQLAPVTRAMRVAAALTSGAFVLELILIVLQAARGVPSHFNFETPFDARVFQAMAVAITVFWLAQGWLTWKAFRFPFAERALGWGLRMGLLVSTLGAGLAFAMPSQVSAQQAAALGAHQPTLIGGHTVGVADGGPGLPVTRWSTEGGDLRVAHFLGLHALQLLPLLGWMSARRRPTGDRANHQAGRRVAVLGLAYAGLVLTTFVQALRGRPLLAPDAVTGALALGVLVLGALGLAWARVARPPAIKLSPGAERRSGQHAATPLV